MPHIILANETTVLVDEEWYPILNRWKWNGAEGGYAVRNIGSREANESVFMHRYIVMAPACFQVDHINQDKRDNRAANLRIVKPQQNYWNRGIQANCTTGYKGVCFDKSRGLYVAGISVNRKRQTLGRFTTAREAAQAYNEAARAHHGEYAWINPL